MKKKLLGLCLLIFLIGCKGEELKTQEVKQENRNTTQVTEVKVSNNIFNEKSLNELTKVQERLKELYNYSTELKYEFLYDGNPIEINEENKYRFRTSNQNNHLLSVIAIDLNNIKPYIYLQNPYYSIEIEYEQYLRIIEKVTEVSSSLYAFKPIRNMEIVIFDNILSNAKETKITLFLSRKGENLIQFINKKDGEEIFNIKLEDIHNLKNANDLESINNIVQKYTPKFLEDVINLSQRYKKLDYIVKNSKEISNQNQDSENNSSLDIDWVNSEDSTATYYASGRIKTLELFAGDEYKFEDVNGIAMLKENMNLLKELLKEKNIEQKVEQIVMSAHHIAIDLNVEESNLNITPEEQKELRKLKEEAGKLFQEVKEKTKNIEMETNPII